MKIVVNLIILEYSFVNMHKVSLEILHRMGHIFDSLTCPHNPVPRTKAPAKVLAPAKVCQNSG